MQMHDNYTAHSHTQRDMYTTDVQQTVFTLGYRGRVMKERESQSVVEGKVVN